MTLLVNAAFVPFSQWPQYKARRRTLENEIKSVVGPFRGFVTRSKKIIAKDLNRRTQNKQK